MFATRRSHNRAFTLIEILVVISVLSVLAGVIYPVLARARERSRQTVCISNLHSLGLAFRMYMQDYDEHRPDRLHLLVRSYLSDSAMLVCPSDGTGNYTFLNWAQRINPLEVWPYPQSYDYFVAGWQNRIWEFLESRGPRSGYILDRCHGEVLADDPTHRAPWRSGLTLRLNMDGSVIARIIHYPRPNMVLNTWYLMNYNPGEPLPQNPEESP